MANDKKNESKSPELKIKLTYLEMANEFFPALNALGDLKVRNVDGVMSIVKAHKVAKEVVIDFNKTRKKLAETDCIKNEDGTPELKDNSYTYHSDAAKKVAMDAIRELEEKTATITVKPIRMVQLKGVEDITPNMLAALGDFIQE